jgi:hypothetical protein
MTVNESQNACTKRQALFNEAVMNFFYMCPIIHI